MPIFTAPPLEGEAARDKRAAPQSAAESVAEPRKKVSPLIVICGAVLVCGAGILGGAWWWNSQSAKQQSSLEKPYEPPTSTASKGETESTGSENVAAANAASSDAQNVATNSTAVKPAGPSVAEMRAEALKKIVDFALDPDKNPNKPFCRRLTAEAFAMVGEFSAVPEQLDQLDKLGGSQLKYYRILPVVAVGWEHFKSGNVEAAKKSADEASALIGSLPEFGALPLESIIELASLLVALDQTEQAKKLLSPRKNEPELEALIESQMRAESTQRFNLDEVVRVRAVGRPSLSGWVGVTFVLTTRGQGDKGLAWARQAPGTRAVAECLAAWAEALAWSGGTTDFVSDEAGQLAATSRGYVLSRLALIHSTVGAKPLAEAALNNARQAFEGANPPAVPQVPDMLGLYNLQLEDSTTHREAALEIVELAHAEAALGNTEQAWKSITKALDFVRGTAPSPALADAPYNAANQSPGAVQAKLKDLLKLKSDDETRLAFNQYRKNCRSLSEAAATRMRLGAEILEAACGWGLVDQVWAEIQARTKATETVEAEPWFDTTVPSAVRAHFGFTGKTEAAADVVKVVTADRLTKNPAPRVQFWLEANRTAEKSPATAPAVLKQYIDADKQVRDKVSWQRESLLRIATGLVAAGRTTDAFAFINAIDDSGARETAYELVSAQATRRGELKLVRDTAYGRGLVPPERVAVLRGFVVNLPAN